MGLLRCRLFVLHRAGPATPQGARTSRVRGGPIAGSPGARASRSEEHTSELQSLRHLVCRLLLEKKKKKKKKHRNKQRRNTQNTFVSTYLIGRIVLRYCR